jgi:hypothetical protein
MFTRNSLCGIALPTVGLTTANFLDRAIDPSVKLGNSTPTMFSRRRCDPPRQLREPHRQGPTKSSGAPTNSAPADGKDPAVAALAAN